MTKQTKLELVQLNARLATENAALRKQVTDLELIVQLKHEPTRRVAAHMPQWQIDRASAMAAARALAMSTRNVVKV